MSIVKGREPAPVVRAEISIPPILPDLKAIQATIEKLRAEKKAKVRAEQNAVFQPGDLVALDSCPTIAQVISIDGNAAIVAPLIDVDADVLFDRGDRYGWYLDGLCKLPALPLPAPTDSPAAEGFRFDLLGNEWQLVIDPYLKSDPDIDFAKKQIVFPKPPTFSELLNAAVEVARAINSSLEAHAELVNDEVADVNRKRKSLETTAVST